MNQKINDPAAKLVTILLMGAAKNAALESKDSGEILIQQGETGAEIFLIMEGEVNVLINEKLVKSIPAPVIVGEMSMLFGKRLATVSARTKIFFRKISQESLSESESRLLRELAELRNRSNLEQNRYSQK